MKSVFKIVSARGPLLAALLASAAMLAPATARAQAVFWTRMAEDGLLAPGVDLAWVIDTASILASAETYLLITRLLGWGLDEYQNWLVTTSARLA